MKTTSPMRSLSPGTCRHAAATELEPRSSLLRSLIDRFRFGNVAVVTTLLGVLLLAAPSRLHAQATATDTLVSPEIEQGELPPIVAQYESQPKTTSVEFTHTQLVAWQPPTSTPPVNRNLIVNPDPAPDYCAPHEQVEGTLFMRLVLGVDDYKFGATTWSGQPFVATVRVRGYNASNVAVGNIYECTLELVGLRPEQICRFDVSNIIANVAYFKVESVTYFFPTMGQIADSLSTSGSNATVTHGSLLSSLRLQVSYTERTSLAAYQKDASDPAEEDPNNPVILEVNGEGGTWTEQGKLGEPITLSWELPEGCGLDEYPSYEIQILRLFNRDTMRYLSGSTSDDQSIRETIDWRRALSFETGPLHDENGDQVREFTLTIAEGRGYYVWRVRPIGDRYPRGIANNRNWGKWSVAPVNGDVVDITGLGAAEATVDGTAMTSVDPLMRKAFFFYAQFDETEGNPERNWAFSRVFTEGEEGTRLHEGMSYITPLLRTRQSQVYLRSEDRKLISETMYDLSGRPVLSTLPAPVEWSRFNYHEDFATYDVSDFDEDATLGAPDVMTGTVDDYYSGANLDGTIPTAEGYPYSRARFMPDGRLTEIGGPGATYRIGGGAGGQSRTARMLYGNASDDELMVMFGDEAPASSSVRTIYRIDPNKVTSVQYVSKEGQTLATALIKASTSELLPLAEYPSSPNGEKVYSGPSRTFVRGTAMDGTDRVYTTEVTILESGEMINLQYNLTAAMFEGCSDFCETCRYKVEAKIYNAEDPSALHYYDTLSLDELIGELCPPGEGDASIELQTDGTTDNLELIDPFTEPGTYVVEFRIMTDRVNPADPYDRTIAQIAADEYRQSVMDELQTDLLSTVDSYLDDDDPTGLYDWLIGYCGPELTIHKIGDGPDGYPNVFEISSSEVEDCWTLEIPVQRCAEEPECDIESIDFEGMLPARWGSTAYNYVDENGNVTGRHFPNEAWEYFYYHGELLPAFGTNPNGTGAFNAMVSHMADDGYSCLELLGAWTAVVEGYAEAVTFDNSGDPGVDLDNVDKEVNLIEEFLRLVGKKYEGVSQCPYGDCDSDGAGDGDSDENGDGYIEYAYKFFEHTIARDGGGNLTGDCEKYLRDMEYMPFNTYGDPNTWGADPRHGELMDTNNTLVDDKRWEMLHNCIQRQNRTPRGVEDLFANCHCEGVDESSTVAEKNACVMAGLVKAEEQCRSVCDMRADGFRQDVIRMYHEEGMYIQGEEAPPEATIVSLMQVECAVAAMIYECESMCNLTPQTDEPSEPGLITGVGNVGEIENIEKVFTWLLRPAIYEGSCSGGDYVSMEHAPVEVTYDAVIRALNRRLAEYREETQDVYSGEYNSDRLLSFMEDLVGPSPSMTPIWTDWGTTVPEARLLGADECPDDVLPSIFEFGPHIRAEFAIVEVWTGGTSTEGLALRSWCEKEGIEYVQEVVLADELWWDECELEICLAWEESVVPENVRTVGPLTCEQMIARNLRSNLVQHVEDLLDELTSEFRLGYAEICLNPEAIDDELILTQQRNLYHFTLFYYDRAGNLVRTVPPAGVQPLTTPNRIDEPGHDLISLYEYNSLGQLVTKFSPDGDAVTFVYDDASRIRFSQDDVQRSGLNYSYTRYDNLSRIVEVGQCDGPAYGDEDGDTDVDGNDLRLALIDAANDPAFPTAGDNPEQRTYTRYTEPDGTFFPPYSGEYIDGSSQRYTLNRVAHIYTDDSVHTQYSYDPHGNVEWVQQHLPGLGANWARYEYDLISGNILELHYNEGWEDGFKHAWHYDKDNRLTEVRTSRDGIIWESDSRYDYYLHGPQRRVEFGEDSVQGRDYVYTLQGWLKAINHPSLNAQNYLYDPGLDGKQTESHPGVAYDAFGMMLEYYKGDFTHDGSAFNSADLVTELASMRKYHLHPTTNLYNGNIASWTGNHQAVTTPPFKYNGQLTGFEYQYDVLNRLRLADFKVYTGATPSNGYGETTTANEYNVSYTYDPNGNITSLTRYGSGVLMDQLTYEYYPGDARNRLRRVRDIVASGTVNMDVDDQNNMAFPASAPQNNFYEYDGIGNLIYDRQEGTTISWSVYGKVTQVAKTSQTIDFTYDASGNRVIKKVTALGFMTKTYYVHDAGGKVLAIYEDVCEATPPPPPDMDRDGVADLSDNCPCTFNPDQANRDNDGSGPGLPCPPGTTGGDACDGDIDGDGLANGADPCPYNNPNTCTPGVDRDSDGIPNGSDNCPCTYNPSQQNTDGDALGTCMPGPTGGDVCDNDLDDDGVPNDHDNCPWVSNSGQQGGNPGDPRGAACEPPGGGGMTCERTFEWIVHGNGAEGRIAVVKPTGVERPMNDDRGVELEFDPVLLFGPPRWVGTPASRILEEKTYELKDHLGNARVMISDLKIPTAEAGGGLGVQSGRAPFKARLHAVNNYDPFGMLQPERHWSTEGHRYGYNGKEMDNEWNNRNGAGSGTGNVYDYGFRIYDPRLGRFMSVDPLASKYAAFTPYLYAENTPIWFIDLDGLNGQPSNPKDPTPPKRFTKLPLVDRKKNGKIRTETRRGTLRDWYNINGELGAISPNTWKAMDGKEMGLPAGAVPKMGAGWSTIEATDRLGGYFLNGTCYMYCQGPGNMGYYPAGYSPDLDEVVLITWSSDHPNWVFKSPYTTKNGQAKQSKPALSKVGKDDMKAASKNDVHKVEKPEAPKKEAVVQAEVMVVIAEPPVMQSEDPSSSNERDFLDWVTLGMDSYGNAFDESNPWKWRWAKKAQRYSSKVAGPLSKALNVFDMFASAAEGRYDAAAKSAISWIAEKNPWTAAASFIDDVICNGCAKESIWDAIKWIIGWDHKDPEPATDTQ